MSFPEIGTDKENLIDKRIVLGFRSKITHSKLYVKFMNYTDVNVPMYIALDIRAIL